MKAFLLEAWNEDYGDVLWWKFPVNEAPYVGSPLDLGYTVEVTVATVYGGNKFTTMVGGWPGYHTHWTPLPAVPNE